MNNWLREQLRLETEVSLSKVGEGKSFFANSIVRSLFLMQLVLVSGLTGFLSFFLRPSDALTVLHYNVYFGVDLLGAWWQTLILPGIACMFVLMNSFMAYRFYMIQRERIAAYLLLLGSTLLIASVFLGCISVVYINY